MDIVDVLRDPDLLAHKQVVVPGALVAAAERAAEREACARVCDAVFEESNNYRVQGYANHCAAAIRARALQ